jgi:hypothetical protein
VRHEPSYFAGLFDGEGSVAAYRTKAGYSTLQVTIQMTVREPVALMHERFEGGRLRLEPARNLRCKPTFHLRWYGQPALRVLYELEPYLIVKREVARLGIEYLESMVASPRCVEGQARRSRLVDEIQELNDSAFHRKRLEARGAQCLI